MLFPQSNDWRAGMQDVSAAIDESMGEVVTVTPIDANASRPNFPAAMLPGQSVQAVAVFTSVAKTVLGSSNGKRVAGFELAPLVSTSDPAFSFAYNAVPFSLSQGVRIVLCRTGELFEVKDVKPDGVSRIVCTVVQLGRQSELR